MTDQALIDNIVAEYVGAFQQHTIHEFVEGSLDDIADRYDVDAPALQEIGKRLRARVTPAAAAEATWTPIECLIGLPSQMDMTRERATEGLRAITAQVGGGFHPDDGVSDLVVRTAQGDVPMFHPEEAQHIDSWLEAVHAAGYDACEILRTDAKAALIVSGDVQPRPRL